jgi:hypothetical protein
MAHALDSRRGRARQLVDEMQQWRGLVWGPQHPIVLEEIGLQSPPDTWPPVIRLDYSIDGIAGRWEAPWDDQVMRESSIEAAASLWLAIVHAHLMDLATPPSEHATAAV